jgi:hypothetical protein
VVAGGVFSFVLLCFFFFFFFFFLDVPGIDADCSRVIARMIVGMRVRLSIPWPTTRLNITREQSTNVTGTYTKHTHEILHFLKNHNYFKLICKYWPNTYLITWHMPTWQCTLRTFNYYLHHATPTETEFVQRLLRMGKWCPKHVEALSFNKVEVIVKCIKLVHVIKLYHNARSAKQNVLGYKPVSRVTKQPVFLQLLPHAFNKHQ